MSSIQSLQGVTPAVASAIQSGRQAAARPEIAKFLDSIKGSIFDGKAPAGATKVPATWEIWGHYGVPLKHQATDLILVIAEGGPYGSAPLDLPVDGGRNATTKGKVVFAAQASDIRTEFEKEKDAQKYGANPWKANGDVVTGTHTYADFDVFARPGEQIRLRYVRLNVQGSGKASSNSGWADDMQGQTGMYYGRQYAFTLGAPDNTGSYDGKAQKLNIYSPEDTDSKWSQMIRQKFV